MAYHYQNLKMVREVIIKDQHIGGRQTKIRVFFAPCCSTRAVGSSSNATPVNSSPSILEIENDENHPSKDSLRLRSTNNYL